jgi:hypothetical protein
MSTPSYPERSVAEIERALGREPRDRRIVHCEEDTAWNPDLLRTLSEHSLNILAQAADIVVFFGADGREVGWRDDGRMGAPQPRWIDRELFRQIVVSGLKLPPDTRLGDLRPRELPPLGWTHEGVLLLKPDAGPGDVLRVWVDPGSQRVIQCIAGPLGGTSL